MKPKLPQWFIILVAAALVLSASTGGVVGANTLEAPAAPAPATLKLAILTALTGGASSLGPAARDGALLAIAQQNAAGGILGKPVESLVEDTACDPAKAVAAANKVISQADARYIIGDLCSGSARAVAEVANAAGVLQMSPTASHPQVTLDADGKVRPYVFRACYINPFQAKVGAQFALKDLKARKAFILFNQNNDYVQSLAEYFSRSFVAGGGQIVAREPYAAEDTDFSAILAKVADTDPDVIYLPDFPGIVNLVTKQAKEKGITAPFVGGDGWDSPDLDVQAADGGYFTTHYSPEDSRPEVAAFQKAFQAAYGRAPDAVAALAYDSVMLLFQAMQEAGTIDPTAVKTTLAGTSFKGVTGSLTYDGYHNPIKAATIMRVDRTTGVHFQAVVNPPPPRLSVNYPNGRPGSYFAFAGVDFPAGKTATVTVNGHTLTDTISADDTGGFAFRLSTADAGEGRYSVTASVNPKATADFILDAAAPLRPSEGSGSEVVVPAGIAYSKVLYLPLLQR
jgi:branched-chain amino acid transport system substrate-binding protein